MKLNDKLMLGFQKNQSSLHVILGSYQFMYTPRDLLKAWIKGVVGMALRGA